MSNHTRRICATLLLPVLLTTTGCSEEAKKARTVKRADTYLTAGERESAKIEYLNALRADPADASLYEKLGQIWLDQGSPMAAYQFFAKVAELRPDDPAAQVKKAEILVTLAQPAEARLAALAVLEKAPGNGGALRILADSSRTPEEIDEAKRWLEKFPEKGTLSYQLAAATLAMKERDLPGAERILTEAAGKTADSPRVHSLLAALRLLQGNRDAAIRELEAAARKSPARSLERVNFAATQVQAGSMDEARKLLEEVTKEAPDYVPAWRSLAQIAFTEKKYDEAMKLLDKAMAIDPDNFEARLVRADVLLAQEKTSEAIELLQRILQSFPAPIVRFQLARAYLQGKDLERARIALEEVVTAAPGLDQAQLLLAQLNLRTGNSQAVVNAMEPLLQRNPNHAQARLLLVDAFRVLGRFDDAAAMVRAQMEADPKSAAAGNVQLGVIYRQQGKTAEAREALQKVLQEMPGNLLAVSQLVEMDLQEKNFQAASEKIQQVLQGDRKSAGAYLLQGRVHAAQQQWDAAETALKKAIELSPTLTPAYDLLVQIYVGTKRVPQALDQLAAVIQQDPRNAGAMLLTALLHEQQGDFAKAREAYEKVLEVAPESSTAQNNLAYLYVERLNEPEKAFELARKARAAQPTDPSIADTLGWTHYKRDEYPQALTLLQESAAALPNVPEAQYHLGMAAYMMGQEEAARAALQKAMTGDAEYSGKADAKERLAFLGQSEDGSSGGAIEALTARLQEHPKDLIARLRLAAAQEAAGKPAEAAATYEAAVQQNPRLAEPFTRLAQLHAGPLDEQAKAFECAKKARELAPNDPKTAGILGRIAYETGNVGWAYNLLQQSAQQLPNDTGILQSLAWAAYGQGKIAEAEEAMQKVAAEAAGDAKAEEARKFLLMIALEREPQKLTGAQGEVEQVLQKDPKHAPAQMARAALHVQQGQPELAITIYQDLLKRLPELAPAQQRLAALYLDMPDKQADALELASKARLAMPEDAEVARILGELRYRAKEYSSAVQLLEESHAKAPLDAEGLFYLGMAQAAAKNDGAKETLNRAIAAGLPKALADEAKQALEPAKEN